MLELAILGLLKQRPMHGYDLRKRLRDDFGPMANLSFGSLYPALARLEATGSVRALETGPGARSRRVDAEATPVLPMTGSVTGERAALVARRATAKAAAALGGRGTRARKVYEITSAGELLFEQLLEAPDARGEEARSFSLRLAFAQHLSPAARVRLLERRRIQLSDRLQAARRAVVAREATGGSYELAIAEHARETVESDLVWVERLLERERAALEEPTGARDALATSSPRAAGRAARSPGAEQGTTDSRTTGSTDGRIVS
ncbi:MAG: PadR family transcriptional regulator [Actinomycetota bacterium]|nr:PadR family transcriptional regulator [Actinomycetota bacterium]